MSHLVLALRPWLPEDTWIVGSAMLVFLILLVARRGKSGLAIGGLVGIMLGFLLSLTAEYPYEVVGRIYSCLITGGMLGIVIHLLVRLHKHDVEREG